MYKERVESCGQRIAKALKIKNMRQADLCKFADVPKSSLSLYLSGAYEPKQNRIFAMARVLGVSEAWLMGYDVPMEREKENLSPSEETLTEGEKLWLELYRKTPEQSRPLLQLLIESFSNIPESSQQTVLGMLRLVEQERK
jgi:transcriptional regulator with XRE-family HTH domain